MERALSTDFCRSPFEGRRTTLPWRESRIRYLVRESVVVKICLRGRKPTGLPYRSAWSGNQVEGVIVQKSWRKFLTKFLVVRWRRGSP